MATRDSEGLQVDYGHDDNAAKAPDAIAQHSPAYNVHEESGRQPTTQASSLPFGLSVWTFSILIAVIAAFIVGGAVGGGLGAALASCDKSEPAESTSCEAPRSSGTSDLYAPIPAKEVKNLTLECPGKDEPGSYSTSGFQFEYYCNMDALPSSTIKGIASIIAYTLKDCLDACGMINVNNKVEKTGVVCDSVVFNRAMSGAVKVTKANCYLRRGKLEPGQAEWTIYAPGLVYGVRV
ncbi:hypothetical protein NW767_014964 [Fusarium falciforme]|nr:hypothetical protein NW767_014964 [Fusarium falciforme]